MPLKWTIISLLLFCNLSSFAQYVHVAQIKESAPHFQKVVYTFPRVVTNNVAVTKAINTDLLQDFLDIDSSQVKKSIFEKVWVIKKHRIPSLSNISYEIIDTNKNTLTLSISAEGCGAYCEEFTNYYTYNLKTGRRLKLDSLFTQKGAARFIDTLNVKRRAIINVKLKDIRNILMTSRFTDSTKYQEYKEMEELYSSCIERSIDDLQYVKFYITTKKLFISLERCSAHVNRALDDLDNIELVFTTDEWRRYLVNPALFQ